MISLPILTALYALYTTVCAVNPVNVTGQDFYDTVTGNRFMLLGVDYQPGGQAGYKPQEGEDALSQGDVCLRDAAVMQRLGVNTIRIYNVDPTLNHDDCASIFNAAGIYMVLDVNSPLSGESINRADPSSSYNSDYLNRVFGVIENFKNYPNTLAFFSANEVMNDIPTALDNPPYIRALQREMKNYIASHASRAIPVGYSAADVREILEDTWNYMQCSIANDTDNASRSDFFGLNSYSWCGGDATFESSGYNDIVAMFGSTTIPIFFSEYGCNEVKPRVFDEVAALYGPQMTSLSGGLIYEYSQEEADYGLVQINANGTVSLRTDYDNLQMQYNQLNITLIEAANTTAANLDPPVCSSDLISNSGLSRSFDLPAVPSGVQQMIDNGIANPVQGRIVDVSDLTPSQEVYGTNGAAVQGLQVNRVADDESNTPNGATPSSSGSADSPAQPSQTGAAAVGTRVEVAVGFVGGVALLLSLF